MGSDDFTKLFIEFLAGAVVLIVVGAIVLHVLLGQRRRRYYKDSP